MINYPEIILADEPTGNLDEANEEIVVDLFHKLHDEGTTLIVVTHDPEVAEVAQKTIVLRNGRVVKEVINENFTGKIHFNEEGTHVTKTDLKTEEEIQAEEQANENK